jgi:negative regulator of sigma E activity
MRSILCRCSSLYVLAVVVLLMALLTFSLRRQQKLQTRLAALQAQPLAAQEQRVTQRAVALLYQALLADNRLTYSATTETWANYGERKMRSQARLTRAPQKLAIAYLEGDKRGLHKGFSERWSWRQDGDAPMRPTSSLARDTTDLAARRFARLLENYSARWQGEGEVDGRVVEIVELWPFKPVDGARGPGKKLWIDRETSLVLRVETYNHQRQPVMGSQLRDVNFNPRIAPDTFKAPQTIIASAQKASWDGQDLGHDEKAVARRTGLLPPRLAPTDLPPGFQLEAVGMHRCEMPGEKKNDYAALSRYTDGLNTLTLFSLKEHAAKAASEQTCQFGPGAVVTRDTPQGTLIAVGDLPPETLRRVVEKARAEVAN